MNKSWLSFISKSLSVAIFIAMVSVIPAESATKPVPGSKCSKQGITQVYKDKRYTCVKFGKKVVWNRGVIIAKPKPVVPTTPKPTPTPATTQSADTRPFIESSVSLNDDICRLKYPNKYETGFGFPRSENRLKSSGVINAVFIFVDFPDAVGTDVPSEVAKKYFDKFNEFYVANSYGKVSFKYEVPNRYFRINKPSNSYSMNMLRGETNPQPHLYFQDALSVSDPFVDFSKYDVVYVIPSNTIKEITYGPAFPVTSDNDILRTDEKIFRNGAVAGTDSRHNKNSFEWVWMVHETGHLFGLEHPWKVQSTPQGATTISDSIAIWDIMLTMWLWAPQAYEFLGWSRFLLNWFDDQNVNCQNVSDSSWKSLNFYISSIATKGNQDKLALIRLSDTTAIAIESRRNKGFDKLSTSQEGVLVYLVDVSKHSNEGMATIITSSKTTDRGLSVSVMKPGQSVTYENLVIDIVSSDASGDYVKVTKK